MVAVIDELPTFPEPLVPHESLALFPRVITVGFLRCFDRLRPVLTQIHTELDCITLLQKLVHCFSRWGCSRYLSAECDLPQQLPTGDRDQSRFEA